MKVDLGDLVRERVSGIEGIITGSTLWMTGCVRHNVQRQGVDKDNKTFELLAFDETQLELLEPNKVPCDNRGMMPGSKASKLVEGGPHPVAQPR